MQCAGQAREWEGPKDEMPCRKKEGGPAQHMSEEAILEVGSPVPATTVDITDMRLTTPLNIFQIPNPQNHEHNKWIS